MSWFQKIIPTVRTTTPKKEVPEGIWTKCPSCGATLYSAELERNFSVCPQCNHHLRIGARKRLDLFLDPDNRVEIGQEITPKDRLKFKDTKRYSERLQSAQKATNENDALVVMRGQIHGLPIVACAFEFSFLGGSMGTVVGEKFVMAVHAAMESRYPLVCFSASGGARMQEGLFSLMQMSKTASALSQLSQEGLPFISVLTDPTMGGVSASLATLGDLIIAEPKALIGFAGPRVIEQTVRETLPEGFQRAEFLLDHGAVDQIVDRRELKLRIARLLAKLTQQPEPCPEADDAKTN